MNHKEESSLTDTSLRGRPLLVKLRPGQVCGGNVHSEVCFVSEWTDIHTVDGTKAVTSLTAASYPRSLHCHESNLNM